MGLPRFFPEMKIHEFEYIPRYYDPRKEDLKLRRARIRKELGKEDAEDVRILQHGTFRRMYDRRKGDLKQANIRRTVLFVILLIGAYFANQYFHFL
ncbi:MAG: hypothetical protein J5882_01910 [Bacteroidales bacterium]|nr:hypothetical protein [Bacteroidales bacterium]MBP5367556.1 hypothetical protein [Bacteroidales bacterium]